ncbi:zonadhesin-like [Eucyclogobius newberryi]|uniref:zonadhesin-like n=1 Tax=Eucyclogobius newberryi TaxID=166745 RepID=UPI003B59DAE8
MVKLTVLLLALSISLGNRNTKTYICHITDCHIDEEYTTFDNLEYEFVGNQSHVLVQTNFTTHGLLSIYIEGIYGQPKVVKQSSEESSEEDEEVVPVLTALKIVAYNHTVVFEKLKRLQVDGTKVETPLSPCPGLKIKKRSSRFNLQTDFGLAVEFDGHGKAKIVLPDVYKGKVGGLCGNFDGNKRNDLMKPDGTQTTSVQEFGESWRV